MSAIRTNGIMETGSVYYIISRALEAAISGSVSLMFSSRNMLAVSLYSIGFAKIVVDNIGTTFLMMKKIIIFLQVVISIIVLAFY